MEECVSEGLRISDLESDMPNFFIPQFEQKQLTRTNLTFNNNYATTSGGAIYIKNSIYLTNEPKNAPYLEMCGNSAVDASDIYMDTSSILPKKPGRYKNINDKSLTLSNIKIDGQNATDKDFKLVHKHSIL